MADDVDLLLGIVPEPFVAAAGLVVTQWAWAENILDQYTWRMLGVRATRGRIVTSNLQARVKIEMLAALLRKSRLDEAFVREIEGEGKALADLRNLIAHGAIIVPPGHETGIVGSFSARGELQVRSRQITAAVLKKLARRMAIYTQFLIDGSDRLPKQRGLQPRRGRANPTPRRLRVGTIAKRLPPLLEVERGLTGDQMVAAKARKAAKKEADRAHGRAGNAKKK